MSAFGQASAPSPEPTRPVVAASVAARPLLLGAVPACAGRARPERHAVMATLSAYERGWRDGFWGREAREACEVYLEGWQSGRRAGDRTVKREEPAEGREEQGQ